MVTPLSVAPNTPRQRWPMMARVADEEQQLPGGLVTNVVRIGDTVRRGRGPRATYVRHVLEFLEAAGWPGAPRFLGIDDSGREILGFIDGQVPWQAAQRPLVDSDECLAAAAGLLREFHDLTAGAPLAYGAEVVCHNDLSPKNTVYRDAGHGLRPVAFLDWDLAAPGARIHDVAHMCWQYAGLGPNVTSVAHAAQQVRAICDGYRLSDRSDVVDTILWWQDRCRSGILAGAAAGDPAMARISRAGAPASIDGQLRWVGQHRSDLDRALR
jgi:phosphotransferase family enzyme